MTLKWTRIFSAVFFFSLVSCGVDEYAYLEPIENVSSTITSSIVFLPGSSAAEFRNYTIFYRLYISDELSTSITTDGERRTINASLASHYNTLDPYTINDNTSPAAIASVFNSLRYYSLFLSSDGVTDRPLYSILNLPGGGRMDLDFTNPNPGSFLTINFGPRFYLFRAAGFTARPNRLFYNTEGAGSLTDTGIITSDVNSDVEPKSIPASPRYTYVSLYVLASGIDDNFSPLYSRPKHIGIFRLPP